jgi:Ser/Thr protein kinase RdoA (MazF antagonist)
MANTTPLGQGPAEWRVHGLGRELVIADWPPLTDAEVGEVLRPLFGPVAAEAKVAWLSPRPLSSAGLVQLPGSTIFVKRHHIRVRDLQQLAAEHALASHLVGQGVAVPMVLSPAVQVGQWVYEVHSKARGLDIYRDAASWTPFRCLGHAHAAGAALARLHLAAASFALPERQPGVLLGSCALTLAPDPVAAVARLVADRPGLARSLAPYRWQDDFSRHVAPAARQLARYANHLPRTWGHCDWHPSNLTWTASGPKGEVAEVIDLGLANLTFAAHDVATAVERSTVPWLDLAERGRAEADIEAVDALLEGYESIRPLPPAEAAAIPEVLPAVHIEYALSEVEYYADVVGSRPNADIAYYDYLIGHTRWFDEPEGSCLTEHLRRRAAAGIAG